MKHEVPVMQQQGSGSIINISSTYGHEGAAGASAYVGSKRAVEGITKSLALEMAKLGIRVNVVAPGPTDTAMLTRFTGTPENKAVLTAQVPLARLGLSEELANAIVFIGSDEASYITGHVLNQRLSRLVEQEILERVPYQQYPLRHEYHLTHKGRDLWLVVTAMRQWGDKWAAPDGPPVDLVHIACGHVTQAVPTCSQCHETLDVRTLRAGPGSASGHPDLTSPEATRARPAGTSAQRRQPRRRRRPSPS